MRRGRWRGVYADVTFCPEIADPGHHAHALFAEKRREDWLRDVHRLEVVRWVPEEMRTARGRADVAARFSLAAARAR